MKIPPVDGNGTRDAHAAQADSTGARPLGRRIGDYFRALMSGTEPLHRVIISDMLIGGTLVNVVAMAAAFALFGIEAPTWLATAVFFAPVPYNLFLVVVVWKTSQVSASAFAWPARILACVWLVAMFFV